MAPLQRIHFEVQGEAQYSRAFEALATEVEDLSEPLGEVGELLRLDVSEQFRTEGQSGMYGRWQELSPDYEKWKRSAVDDEPILVRTGQMRAAAISRDAITVTPRSMTYEIDDPKAAFHQTGPGDLPQRRLIDLSLDQRREWDRAFASWLNKIRRGPLASA